MGTPPFSFPPFGMFHRASLTLSSPCLTPPRLSPWHPPPGSLKTTATYIREFVRSHPDYKFDSVVSQEINYDLIKRIDAIERGEVVEDSLLGKNYIGSDHLDIDLSVCGLLNVKKKK